MADIPVKNIYYMLSYAYNSLNEDGFKNVASEEFKNIHDLFAAILVNGVSVQIKRGLHRDYITQEEALSGLRGQVRLSESIKQSAIMLCKLVCQFDEFTEDSPHNRALKSTMALLLRKGNVKNKNKLALKKLMLYFSNVTEINPFAVRWDSLKYHRNNAAYKMLLNICKLVTDGLLLSTEDGGYKLSQWLNDEEMYRLYEKFVRAYYVREHRSLTVSALRIDWDIVDDCDKTFLPSMKTDITLTNKLNGKVLIIDTKFVEKTMKPNEQGNLKFISANLYQIYAYVKNMDKQASGNVAGALLRRWVSGYRASRGFG